MGDVQGVGIQNYDHAPLPNAIPALRSGYTVVFEIAAGMIFALWTAFWTAGVLWKLVAPSAIGSGGFDSYPQSYYRAVIWVAL